MRRSARSLGAEYGLTSQEMNQLLKSDGFLEGDPGSYSVTEKGEPFANEEYFHRGTGGYDRYNRYWTERTWDDSILDALDVTQEKWQAAKDATRLARQEQAAARRAEREAAERYYQATGDPYYTAEKAEALIEDGSETEGSDAAKGLGYLIGVGLLAAYGVKKAYPHVKRWWKDTVQPKFSRKKEKRNGSKREKSPQG